jgi:hypothetical protein
MEVGGAGVSTPIISESPSVMETLQNKIQQIEKEAAKQRQMDPVVEKAGSPFIRKLRTMLRPVSPSFPEVLSVEVLRTYMALKNTINVHGQSDPQGSGPYYYSISCSKGNSRWSVRKRYTDFREIFTKIKSSPQVEYRTMHSFPKKTWFFERPDPNARVVELNNFMQEVVSKMNSSKDTILTNIIHEFVATAENEKQTVSCRIHRVQDPMSLPPPAVSLALGIAAAAPTPPLSPPQTPPRAAPTAAPTSQQHRLPPFSLYGRPEGAKQQPQEEEKEEEEEEEEEKEEEGETRTVNTGKERAVVIGAAAVGFGAIAIGAAVAGFGGGCPVVSEVVSGLRTIQRAYAADATTIQKCAEVEEFLRVMVNEAQVKEDGITWDTMKRKALEDLKRVVQNIAQRSLKSKIAHAFMDEDMDKINELRARIVQYQNADSNSRLKQIQILMEDELKQNKHELEERRREIDQLHWEKEHRRKIEQEKEQKIEEQRREIKRLREIEEQRRREIEELQSKNSGELASATVSAMEAIMAEFVSKNKGPFRKKDSRPRSRNSFQDSF